MNEQFITGLGSRRKARASPEGHVPNPKFAIQQPLSEAPLDRDLSENRFLFCANAALRVRIMLWPRFCRGDGAENGTASLFGIFSTYSIK
jgi:hypothetical protein